MAIIRDEFDRLANLSEKSNGSFGAHFIADTDQHTAFIENTVFNAITASNWSGDTITSETFPEGLTIYGDFSVIDLTSGACIAYFATKDNTVTTA
mgnify:CR=1 FL=1